MLSSEFLNVLTWQVIKPVCDYFITYYSDHSQVTDLCDCPEIWKLFLFFICQIHTEPVISPLITCLLYTSDAADD